MLPLSHQMNCFVASDSKVNEMLSILAMRGLGVVEASHGGHAYIVNKCPTCSTVVAKRNRATSSNLCRDCYQKAYKKKYQKETSEQRTQTNSHTNYRYLTTDEKSQRLKNAKRVEKNLVRKTKRQYIQFFEEKLTTNLMAEELIQLKSLEGETDDSPKPSEPSPQKPQPASNYPN